MSDLFGEPNSFLGGNDEDELPLIIGAIATLFCANDTAEVVLLCGTCEQRYALPEVVDDVRLLEMCPCCAYLSGGAVEAPEPPGSSDG